MRSIEKVNEIRINIIQKMFSTQSHIIPRQYDKLHTILTTTTGERKLCGRNLSWNRQIVEIFPLSSIHLLKGNLRLLRQELLQLIINGAFFVVFVVKFLFFRSFTKMLN